MQCSYLHLLNIKGASYTYTIEYYFSLGKKKTVDTTIVEINSTSEAIIMIFHYAQVTEWSHQQPSRFCYFIPLIFFLLKIYKACKINTQFLIYSIPEFPYLHIFLYQEYCFTFLT